MKDRIGILPSLVTLGNLVCGFAAIGLVAMSQIEPDKMRVVLRLGDPFVVASWLILLAMVFDALDGKIARMANLTSEFGAQLDSLCDMISFGAAPAFLVFLEVVNQDLFRHSRYAWVCAALYVICAALRLARFNVETSPNEASHRYFQGLPSPAAAGVLAGLIMFRRSEWAIGHWAIYSMPVASVVLGALMISRIRYIHLLNMMFRHRKPFTYLVLLIFAIFTVFALAESYELILLVGFGSYVLSGPIHLFLRIVRRSAKPAGAR